MISVRPSRASTAARLCKEEFDRLGFVVLPNVISPWERESVRKRVLAQIDALQDPIEFEADTGYPGAPSARNDVGGLTPRRLLGALDRDGAFLSLALNPGIVDALRRIFNNRDLVVSRAHHNCLMTKCPEFSSDTLWHRDSRYWAFDRPDLITAWVALQEESAENGSLSVVPGSHRQTYEEWQFDDRSFFLIEDPRNRSVADAAINLRLNPGDVLLFHCQLLHSATRNYSDRVKISPVFTYHCADNRPLPGTRSAGVPGLRIRDV